MAQELTAERLRELLHYDPETGVMTRRVALSNRTKVGDEIGRVNPSDGYRYACVDGKSHAVHRLVWLYVTGNWPEHQVNHDNDVRDDNRWTNLRDRPKAVHLAERASAYQRERTKLRLPRDGAKAQEILLSLFAYEPDTGLLRWIAKPTKYANIEIGQVAGSIKSRGYVYVDIDGRGYRVHRLIWVMLHGEWPAKLIDHRDGVKSNNREENIRPADHRLNNENKRKAMPSSSTGLLGAHKSTSRPASFRATIRARGKQYYLGSFKTAAEAHAAYVCAKRRLHEGNTL